jgi:phosphoribosyl-ATP pyrophosphohydrolase
MKTHELKILPQYFNDIQDGSKTFEIRKNDRGFEVGDKIILKEFERGADNFIDVRIKTGYTGNETTKEISYILKGGKYGLEEGYCILGLKQEGIELKNIDLTGWNGLKQCEKIEEEIKEFYEATAEYLHSNTQESKDHAIEEYLDTLQSCLGLLAIAGISAEEVMKEYPKHLKKIEKRPRLKNCDNCKYCRKETKTYISCKPLIKYWCSKGKDTYKSIEENKKCDNWEEE